MPNPQSKVLSIEDIKYVLGELKKYYSTNAKDFTPWEQDFLRDIFLIMSVIEAGGGYGFTNKQLFNIYKLYYKHIEGDDFEFEGFCTDNGMKSLWNEWQANLDKYRDKHQR